MQVAAYRRQFRRRCRCSARNVSFRTKSVAVMKYVETRAAPPRRAGKAVIARSTRAARHSVVITQTHHSGFSARASIDGDITPCARIFPLDVGQRHQRRYPRIFRHQRFSSRLLSKHFIRAATIFISKNTIHHRQEAFDLMLANIYRYRLLSGRLHAPSYRRSSTPGKSRASRRTSTTTASRMPYFRWACHSEERESHCLLYDILLIPHILLALMLRIATRARRGAAGWPLHARRRH